VSKKDKTYKYIKKVLIELVAVQLKKYKRYAQTQEEKESSFNNDFCLRIF